MADCEAVFSLANCHPSILQHIIGLCDKEDLFLLRLVSRRFRDAVGQRVRRLLPRGPPGDLAANFPNLVSLDLRCLFARVTRTRTLPLPQLPRLRELCLSEVDEVFLDGSSLLDEWQPALQALTRLHLRSVGDGTAFLDCATRCSSLRCLQISGSCGVLRWEVLHRVVARLAGSLVRLEIPPDQESLYLAWAPARCLLPLNTGKLQALRVKCCSIADEICAQLRAFTSLTALGIACDPLSDEGIAQLCALTQLTRLWVDRARRCSCAGVAQLSRLPRLADLSLSVFAREEGDMPLGHALAGLPSLRRLELAHCDNVELLGTPSRLTNLELQHCSLRGEPCCLLPLTGLRSLEICGRCWEKSLELRYLSGMVQLTRLDINSSALKLSASCAGWLARLTALQQLRLEGVWRLTVEAMEQLAGLPALRALALSLFAQQQLPALAPLERLPLEWLWLPQCYKSADELPERLRVPFLKGRRRGFNSLVSDRLQWPVFQPEH